MTAAEPHQFEPSNPLSDVQHVIAVGAGKGGVGKSTVALLTAVGLLRRGKRVALLDADVYGPSIPKMTGSEDQQPGMDDNKRLIPIEVDGLKIVSLGHLMTPDQAVIWRGPMAQKYVKEMLDVTLWGPLDYLIVDLPPGTGDIPLTLAQSIPLTGAIVVCTPQDVALADAVRALQMYRKLGVHPLGFVENMSYYICPHCGSRDELFSHGGTRQAAEQHNVPFLGEIPLNVALRTYGDQGRPFAAFDEVDEPVRAALDGMVDTLLTEVDRLQKATGIHLPQVH